MVEPTSKISEESYLFREPAELWVSEKEVIPIDPYSLFILAIRSPVTRAKYLQRMGYFLDFLEIPKSDDYGSTISIENRINGFAQRARADVNWLTDSIVRYLHGHNAGRIRKHQTNAEAETLDSLYERVKRIWRKYVDADDFHISICAADTVYTNYQDKLGLTHYLFFVGNNGSGKSNNLTVLQCLAHRNMTSTDMTSANIYQFLGSAEEGQGTL